jgi:hypothetical protein
MFTVNNPANNNVLSNNLKGMINCPTVFDPSNNNMGTTNSINNSFNNNQSRKRSNIQNSIENNSALFQDNINLNNNNKRTQ